MTLHESTEIHSASPRAKTTHWMSLTGESSMTLVARLCNELRHRMDQRLLRPGSRLPSIRQCADRHGVSRFTVVEAYERLVAQGYLESRRGSGFYVRERRPLTASPTVTAPPPTLDVVWLARAMFQELPPERMPGSGLLPPDWLDSALLGRGLRATTRGDSASLLGYGEPQGYAPLRSQLQITLAEIEIAAAPEQIVLTAGVTQALDLIARQFLRPGDAVLVDDPGWFLMFGM
ncbi:MAG: aminotransferase class I/II-fold pyridoxal phosphate-dependent enzyme, partial [Candidatus Competibacteraceae bacterium]|nr:aminotransferase class I/II-fold pyridoxal phosphate-dependent enzyme [Candidatus Competibacteraceae bacterium]